MPKKASLIASSSKKPQKKPHQLRHQNTKKLKVVKTFLFFRVLLCKRCICGPSDVPAVLLESAGAGLIWMERQLPSKQKEAGQSSLLVCASATAPALLTDTSLSHFKPNQRQRQKNNNNNKKTGLTAFLQFNLKKLRF